MPMQPIPTGADGAEDLVTENFETLDHQAVFGKRHPATSGLVWAWYGGRWGGLAVPDGSVTLANASTSYLVAARATGAVTAATSTTNWDDVANYGRLYKVTTAGGLVTAVEDHRAGPAGVHGQLPPPAAPTIASAATLTIPPLVQVVIVSGTTGVTNITATGRSGQRVTLVFQGALTVTDGGNLRLAGNFTTTADDTLTLACDGTNWYETARSVN